MKYTVVYFKDMEECARDHFMEGTTIPEIVEELTYEFNRHGKNCEYVTIFDANNEEDIAYFKVATVDCKYKLIELV